MMDIVRGLIGLGFFIGIGYLFSGHKKSINWRLVVIGVALQLAFGIIITKIPGIDTGFLWLSKAFVKFLSFSENGAEFLVGSLSNDTKHNLGFIFIFQVLPTIIFFSTVSAALYYLGILQKVVYGIAWIMAKTMGLSGAESLSAAGNIFLGQTEAPLLVRPFVKTMTTSELMCLMSGGMATIAGGVLALYVKFLGGGNPVEEAQMAAHLLTASVMNAPAAIVMAKMLVPEMEGDKLDKNLSVSKEQVGTNLLDAMAGGAVDGMKLAANVGAMLLAFVGVIFMLNYILSKVGMVPYWGDLNELAASSLESANLQLKELTALFASTPEADLASLNDKVAAATAWRDNVQNMPKNGYNLNEAIQLYNNNMFPGLSFEYILGQLFRPIAFIMGVEWKDCLQFGSLLGVKTAVNELIAYTNLSAIKGATSPSLSPKSITMATFALCGFANFSSIAIQIGGIGGMAPERQGDLSRLGLKALLAAAVACMMTGTVAGMLF